MQPHCARHHDSLHFVRARRIFEADFTPSKLKVKTQEHFTFKIGFGSNAERPLLCDKPV